MRYGLGTVMAMLVLMGADAPPPVIRDADTRAWWAITRDLASDAMEGRDVGTPGYARAADDVARRFKAAGLAPAGHAGTYLQKVAMTEARVENVGTAFTLARAGGTTVPLRFLHDISVRATAALPTQASGPISFRGYCGKEEVRGDLRGRILLCFGNRRRAVPTALNGLNDAVAAGVAGIVVVDDPGFTIEPPRWPEAYARTVALAGDGPPANAATPRMRLSAAAFATIVAGSGRDAQAILQAGSASRPLPAFDLPTVLTARFHVTTRRYDSWNVLGLLPGTDPTLSAQVVVLSAHLDGYGHGEPVAGDGIYNGAFDDAAYVATLIRLAEQRAGKGYRRSVLFAAFTGEEKGLLGARRFVADPTVPRARLVADINLDQLRPLFPLRLLTVHALDDTTLGTSARRVAAARGIAVQADPEPERNLLRRADHWPFLEAGIPATGFVFGYAPGSESERRYRLWYETRYHRPQDDLGQPWEPRAAADFNGFFYALAADTANADAAPSFAPASPIAPHGR